MIGAEREKDAYKAGQVKTRWISDHGAILWPSSRFGCVSRVIASSFSAALTYGALVSSGVSGKYMNPIIAIGKVIKPSITKTCKHHISKEDFQNETQQFCIT